MKIPSFLAVGFPRLSTKLSLLLAVPLLLGPAGLVTAQTFTTLHSAARSSDARNSSRMPLVSATFNLAKARSEMNLAGLKATVMPNPNCFVNFDFIMDVAEKDGEMELTCTFNTDLTLMLFNDSS